MNTDIDLPDGLQELAFTHAALTRLAALIAQGVSPAELFAAVTREVRRRFGPTTARMIRYEPDGTATVLANEGTAGPHVRIGEQWRHYPATGLTKTIWTTGRPARVDDYRDLPGGERYVAEGLLSAVGVPIFVHGTLWGLIAIGSSTAPLPLGTEERLTTFTRLTATAIATAQGRAEVAASRARIVAASDESRRRIERDLHDGAQQQLVTLAMRMAMLSDCATTSPEMRAELKQASKLLSSVMDELREIAQGIYPAVLSQAGLGPALRTLARRSAVPVEVQIGVTTRLPTSVEVAAYYMVSEMLTNAVKHANASTVNIRAVVANATLHVSVVDDGIGGADPTKGSGLLGLQDRVEALGGRLRIHSPTGGGTSVNCAIPLADNPVAQSALNGLPK
ncbi:MAG: GAF domain-containing sensor histidine kinase [Mycobacterium sp.]